MRTGRKPACRNAAGISAEAAAVGQDCRSASGRRACNSAAIDQQPGYRFTGFSRLSAIAPARCFGAPGGYTISVSHSFTYSEPMSKRTNDDMNTKEQLSRASLMTAHPAVGPMTLPSTSSDTVPFPLARPATIRPAGISVRLALCLTTIYRMLEEGTIPALKSPGGGKWIISRRRYEEWESSFGRSGRTSAGT